jgi:hypothetical protein
MTTSQPKPQGFESLDAAVQALGGYPPWTSREQIAVPPLTPEQRAAANRGLASGAFYSRKAGGDKNPTKSALRAPSAP